MNSLGWTPFVIKDKVCLIDVDDFHLINKHTWNVTKKGHSFYICSDYKGKRIYLHRLILKPNPNELVDHINRNGLDNRKRNLRICSKSTNAMNSKKQATRNNKICSSKYKGVSWNKRDKYFEAYINVNKKRIRLGYYKNELEAAKAYDAAAKLYHKQFARLNFEDNNG